MTNLTEKDLSTIYGGKKSKSKVGRCLFGIAGNAVSGAGSLRRFGWQGAALGGVVGAGFGFVSYCL